MSITTSTEPLVVHPNRLAKAEARTEMQRLGALDLPTQAAECRQIIVVAGQPTNWTKPVSENLPPFFATQIGKERRVFLQAHDGVNFAVYDSEGKNWTRRTLTRRDDIILAALPSRALKAIDPAADATPKQLDALRKFLDLAPTAELPKLHRLAVSRLIERVLIERHLPQIVEDLHNCVEARVDENAA